MYILKETHESDIEKIKYIEDKVTCYKIDFIKFIESSKYYFFFKC